MRPEDAELSIDKARQRLGLAADAPLSDLQAAFQQALQASRGADGHTPPDAYREILEAYRVLRGSAPTTESERRFEAWPSHIELTPAEAIAGGSKAGRLPTGRPFETKLPPGLRDGDLVWVWGWLLQVRIDAGEDLAICGDDIWITAHKPPSSLKAGMRVAVETPLGPFSFRLTEEAVERGLVRAPGLGLPASRGHAEGDLYVRLLADRRDGVASILKRLTHRAA